MWRPHYGPSCLLGFLLEYLRLHYDDVLARSFRAGLWRWGCLGIDHGLPPTWAVLDIVGGAAVYWASAIGMLMEAAFGDFSFLWRVASGVVRVEGVRRGALAACKTLASCKAQQRDSRREHS